MSIGILKPGDKIQAVGFPLLSGINDGRKWTVEYIKPYNRFGVSYVYGFKRGSKTVIHPVFEVDGWITEKLSNRFDIVK